MVGILCFCCCGLGSLSGRGNSHKLHRVPKGKKNRVVCKYNLVKNLGEHSDIWSMQCSGSVRR